MYNKADSYSRKGLSEAAQKHFSKADTLGENALTYLIGELSKDASLQMWFDRHLSWNAENADIGITPAGLPLPITSNSLSKKSNGVKEITNTIRQTKIATLEDSLHNLDALPTIPTKDHEAIIKKKLARFKKLLDD